MVSAERFAQGMTVPEYVAQMHTNREAFTRLLAEAAVRPEDREAMRALGRKIKILTITEDWCPDSLRTIPVLARLVDGLPDVEMRVFLRDDSPDVMDQYLKRGQFRAIPVGASAAMLFSLIVAFVVSPWAAASLATPPSSSASSRSRGSP